MPRFAAAAHYNFSGSCWVGSGGFGTEQPVMGAHHAETHKEHRVDLCVLSVGWKKRRVEDGSELTHMRHIQLPGGGFAPLCVLISTLWALGLG